jgi:hypothetical protein
LSVLRLLCPIRVDVKIKSKLAKQKQADNCHDLVIHLLAFSYIIRGLSFQNDFQSVAKQLLINKTL